MPSEAELLDLARGGDPDAFAALIAPLQRRAFSLAYRMLGESEEAADVTQDALVRAYTRLAEFRGEASFGTWLHRIVHNTALDALRWRARHPAQTLEPTPAAGGEPTRELAAAAPGPEEIAVRADQRRAIERALAALPPEFRAAVVLRDVQGLDYAEVAAITGTSLGTVKSRLHRARARLRALLAGQGLFGAAEVAPASAGEPQPHGAPKPARAPTEGSHGTTGPSQASTQVERGWSA